VNAANETKRPTLICRFGIEDHVVFLKLNTYDISFSNESESFPIFGCKREGNLHAIMDVVLVLLKFQRNTLVKESFF
jgi:hypothetical protein